ncbi:MAG: acetyl-CoA C-acetyltransferase [Myxococcales bacterium]|nr:acetyl-CoA C-acetyltransferase [Myxococcales bacterium]MCB9550374.1 acetyl-CoA C-acetyltransferase [Myxococcales bacterium]
MADAFIYDAVRTPRGRGKAGQAGKPGGALYTVPPVELLATTLRALRERVELDTAAVDDVTIGCVTQVGEQGACIARTAVIAAGYDEGVPGVTLNRFCGSGLEAVNNAAAQVAAGFSELVIAGGVESMSRVKMGSDGGALMSPHMAFEPGIVPQGISADLLATLHGIRRGDADAFAVRSQKNAAAAWERGAFDRSLTPVVDHNGLVILDRDEHLRPDTTLDGLARLAPSFAVMGAQFGVDALTKARYPEIEHIDHIHHAGNSSGIVDGAAAVLIGNAEMAEVLGHKPRARIRAVASVGDEPVIMLAGPVPATRKALRKAGMEIGDIDLFEVNEAFAAVPLYFMQALGVDPDRVNVNGGAIALGHPLGATGAILLGTVLDELEARDLQTGLVTLCIGGGMGIATIIERV